MLFTRNETDLLTFNWFIYFVAVTIQLARVVIVKFFNIL